METPEDFTDSVLQAKNSNRPVMVFFTAPWYERLITAAVASFSRCFIKVLLLLV